MISTTSKASTLSSVAALNLSCYLHARSGWGEKRVALQRRRTVALAVGILVVRHRCSIENAYQLLAQGSAEQGVSVHDIATVVVSDAPGR